MAILLTRLEETKIFALENQQDVPVGEMQNHIFMKLTPQGYGVNVVSLNTAKLYNFGGKTLVNPIVRPPEK